MRSAAKINRKTTQNGIPYGALSDLYSNLNYNHYCKQLKS